MLRITSWRRMAYERSTAQIILGVSLIVFGICIIIFGPSSSPEFFHYLKKFYNRASFYSLYIGLGVFFIAPGVFLVIVGVIIKTKYSYWEAL